MRTSLALFFLVLAAFAGVVATPASATSLDAIEYYNASLDHYFVTVDATEISRLDGGFFVGWRRTGLSFKVLDAATPQTGSVPVCRFYGSPSAGLDSHFYSASQTECADVARKFANVWLLESDNVFQVLLPDAATGHCAAGSVPVYRSWNTRADSNHRYTTDLAVQNAMLARGFVAEGSGSPPVVMCSPDPAAAVAPVCTLSASSSNPAINTQITLSASCSGSPTEYAWAGCSSSGPTCTTTASSGGVRSYSMVAANGAGLSPQARIDVNWVGAAPPPPDKPVCQAIVAAGGDTPVINTSITLTAVCSFGPTTYAWSGPGCTGVIDRTCTTTAGTPGAQTYTVVGINAGGSSTPSSVTVNWQASAPPPPANDFCGQYQSVLRTNLGWANVRLFSTDYGSAGFAWNGVWSIRLTVPANATATQLGHATVAEWNGPLAVRELTLSRSACDFRGTDPSGFNGPLDRSNATTANIWLSLGTPAGFPVLTPGETYYLNIRNVQVQTGTITCPQADQRCDAFVDVTLPR